MNLEKLSYGEKFVVEWQYGMLGSFREALVYAIMKADIVNSAKLAKGFPEEVKAIHNYQNVEGWWESVQEKLK